MKSIIPLLLGLLTVGSVSATTVLVVENTPMRYLANTNDPGIGVTWTAELFNDSSWSNGIYGVGYERSGSGGVINLAKTTVHTNSYSVYTRSDFVIADTGTVYNLFVDADYDDGFVAWINGVEVFRSATMPAGAPDWDTNASSHESSNDFVPEYGVPHDISTIGLPLLHNGTNVLAIGVWNNGAPTSSDLLLSPYLAINDPGPAVSSAQVLIEQHSDMLYLPNQVDPAGSVDATWMNEVFNDSGWTAGTYGVGYNAGSLIQTVVPSDVFSVYTRSIFVVTNLATLTNVFLGADYCDGYTAWINGTEVFRSSEMPGGALAWNSNAGSHESSNGTQPAYGVLNHISPAAIPAIHVGTNVLAIGAWNRNAPTSSDLALVPRLSINEPLEVTRGPYLLSNHENGITVRWRTTYPESSRVRYGDAPGNLTNVVSSATLTDEHEVVISGLTRDTTYFYSIGTTAFVLAGDDADHFFKTAPEAGKPDPTRIWVVGDSGTANNSARAVRNAYAALGDGIFTDLFIMLGDNAYNDGTDAQYQAAMFDMYPDILRQTPVWSTLGNHDGHSADSDTQSGPYYEILTFPKAAEVGGVASGTEAYYSWDHANIHFICLDAYETDRSVGGPMLTWMEQDLMAATNEWLIAYWHHPPYTKGTHNSDTEGRLIDMRQNALPILEAHGVDLVLGGHSHAYERSYFLNGHYGNSWNLDPATMFLDAGNGKPTGDGAYERSKFDIGTVYVVAGSSGKTGNTYGLNHPAMYYSEERLGSLVLDINGLTLDARFLDHAGAVRDSFTIEKNLDPADMPDGITRSAATGYRVLASSLVTDDIPQLGGELTVIQVNAPTSGMANAYLLGPYVVYQPNSGYTGMDSFTYVVMEAGGTTSTGTVTMYIASPDGQTQNITSINPQPGPTIQIRGAGVPGRSYRIECTTDAGDNWIFLGNALADGVGQFLFNHNAAPTSAFYRALPATP